MLRAAKSESICIPYRLLPIGGFCNGTKIPTMYRRCMESTIIRITEENIIPVCFAHTNQKKAGERNEKLWSMYFSLNYVYACNDGYFRSRQAMQGDDLLRRRNYRFHRIFLRYASWQSLIFYH